jgi:protoheme IX farnesyltransferase
VLSRIRSLAYSAAMSSPAVPLAPALPADWRDFLALTKPRVMTLVVFTGLCGMLAAPVHIHPVLGFTAILCIALGAGASGALNNGTRPISTPR